MIGIVDYGLGNVTSVAGAVERLGAKCVTTSDADALQRCEKLILPGVGAFGDGMKKLRERGLIEPLEKFVRVHCKPILGICLGSQLMMCQSEEFGHHEGLGWIEGHVRRIDVVGDCLRVPHVGWNDIEHVGSSILWDGVSKDDLFYYVHSYCIEAEASVVIGECTYGTRFVAAFQSGNIYGTQFHPEKSQFAGLTLMRNFIEQS